MTKRILFIMLIVTGIQLVNNAQTQTTVNWAHILPDDASGSDMSTSVVVDASGNTYITGRLSGTADFDPGAGTANLTSNGNIDAFFAKYDASGSYVFAFSFGTTTNEITTGIALDASGNILITGFFSGTVDFDPGAGTANRTSVGLDDAFLAKYSPTGAFIYAFALGSTTSYDYSSSLITDASDNVYLTGNVGGTTDFDPGVGTANLTAFGGSLDAFVAKYDASGNYVFAFLIGSTSNTDDGGRAIALDASNNILVTGSFSGTADFDPSGSTANLTSNGSGDIFIGKYSSAGAYINAINIGGSGNDIVYDLTTDASSNVFITGVYYSTIDFDPGVGTENRTVTGSSDMYIAKYSSALAYVYAVGMEGTSDFDYGIAVATDASGNAYVAGALYGSTDFDGSGSTSFRHGQGADIFVAKYNSTGDLLFAMDMGSNGAEIPLDMALDASNNVYICGYAQNNARFAASCDVDPIPTNGGAQSGFIVKYTFVDAPSWTGAVNSNWSLAGNWLSSTLPAVGGYAVIPTGLGTYPTLDVDVNLGFIAVEPGASVTIPANRTLDIADTLTNNGTITVKTGGSLVQSGCSEIAGSGTYNVESSLPGDISFICSPIADIAVTGFGITPTGANGGQITPNTANPCNPDSIDAASPYGNLLELDETLTPIANCAQSLWKVKSTGSLTNSQGYSLANGATTLTYSGTINNGIVIFFGLGRQTGSINQQDGSTATYGWHLVGNPYPSPIQLTATDLTNYGFDAQIQRYDDATGGWISNDPLVSATIAVGQGFQVRVAAVGGSAAVVMQNTLRVAGNPTFYKQANPRDEYLNIVLNNGTVTDETMVYFYDGATENFDPLYDANRLMGRYSNPLLYTVAAGERLSYNAYPFLNAAEERIVPLGVHDGDAGNFTLTFNDVSTLNVDELYLEDLLLNTITPITNGMVYNFTTTEGDDNERFNIIFKKDEVTTPTGIAAIDLSKIKLYPNPVQGDIMLELPAKHSFSNAAIFNVMGQQMSTTVLTTNEASLPTSNLAAGIYYVKLQGAYATTLKFVKQ